MWGVFHSFRYCVAGAACLIAMTVPQASIAQNAPERFAFVVGNSVYERTPDGAKLRNSRFNLETPANDARRYVDTLSGLGWNVLNEANTERTASGLLNDLDAASAQISDGSEVLFIFNGHGFSDGPDNFLVGIPENGRAFTSVGDMRTGSLNLSEVVQRLSRGNPSRIILVINACGDEPLVDGTTRAPAKPSFDTSVGEVLVLYSSSPRGVAYDYVDNTDLERAEPLSLFTRAFVANIEEDRPLLDIFIDVRQEVERLSTRAAKQRNLPGRSALQIPHILFDTINGQFNLANVSSTTADAALEADWRLAPSACRFDSAKRDEALQIRAERGLTDDVEGQSVRDCIVAAALGDMGIESLTFDGDRNGPVVNQSSPEADFALNAVIRSVTVTPQGESRQRIPPTSIDVFYNLLAQNYFAQGTNITFGWQRNDGGLPSSGFEQKNF